MICCVVATCKNEGRRNTSNDCDINIGSNSQQICFKFFYMFVEARSWKCPNFIEPGMIEGKTFSGFSDLATRRGARISLRKPRDRDFFEAQYESSFSCCILVSSYLTAWNLRGFLDYFENLQVPPEYPPLVGEYRAEQNPLLKGFRRSLVSINVWW